MLLNFDYDGVIADSLSQYLRVITRAQEILGAGRPPVADDFRSIENLTYEDFGARLGIPADRIAEFEETTISLQKENWEVEPFPGIVEVLTRLATNHTLTVITNSHSAAVTDSLDRFGIGPLITEVLGGELGTSKDERLDQVRAAVSLSRKEPFMIGDTIGDIREGKIAGVKTIAVTWGFQHRELLEAEEPDLILDSPDELLKL